MSRSNEGDSIKFNNKSDPKYWDIDSERIYIVQKTEYDKGDQRMVRLYNKNHKLRWYPDHLFDVVKEHDYGCIYDWLVLELFEKMCKESNDLMLQSGAWPLDRIYNSWLHPEKEGNLMLRGLGSVDGPLSAKDWAQEIIYKLNDKFKKYGIIGKRMRFRKGKEADKFKGRIFVCQRVQHRCMLNANVKLCGLYGIYRLNQLEFVEDGRATEA